MNENIKNMLRDAYELEGLLMLSDSRGGDISEIVISAIRDKIESLASNAIQLKPSTSVQIAKEEANAKESKASLEEVEIEEPTYTETYEETTAEDSEIDSNDKIEATQEIYIEPTVSEADDIIEVENTDNKKVAEESDNKVAEDEDNDASEGQIIENIPTVDESDEKITIDEAYIRNKSKNLSNAFSINDMFRFRRELFGNNAAEMADAINLVDAMHSYDEAEDYFYNELGWDKESEEVAEFMTIIKNHFI